MEELNNLDSFAGIGSSAEVSEEEKQRVQEDAKKAAAAKQQVKANQKDNAKKAKFLEKILEKFYYNDSVLANVFSYIVDWKYEKLYAIFNPVLENKYSKVSEYVDYLLKTGFIDKDDIKLILEVVKSKKIWNISNLSQDMFNELIKSVEEELQKNLK